MLLSSDRDGSVIAHPSGVHQFPAAGMPVEVPDGLGAHLLAAGGFSLPGNRPEGMQTMWLRKEQGGCEITHRGAVYAWENDGDAAEVPDDLAVELVALGGFQVVPEPDPADDGEEDAGGDGGQEDTPGGEDSPEDGEPDGGTGEETPAGKPATARRSRAKGAPAKPAG